MQPRIIQKALLFNADNKILLLKRSESDGSRPGDWDLPGGGFDEGETLENSIQREIFEEVGIDAKSLRLIGAAQSYHEEKDQHRIFLNWGALAGSQDVILSHEHSEFRWESLADAAALLGESAIWSRVIGLIDAGLVEIYVKTATAT